MSEVMTPVALAVDGGNSKTDVAVITSDGEVVGFARSGGASHEWLGVDAAIAALGEVISAALAEAGAGERIEVGIFCLAGIDLPVDDRMMGGAVARQAWADEVSVHNDAFAVLRAGTERDWGIGIVCGAGMNCVAVAPNGDAVRFPALGDISGDRAAGGHWIGVQALGRAMRATDGRGPRTILERVVPRHFGLDSPLAVLEAMRVGKIDEGAVTALPPVVFEAAARDEVARGLLDEVAAELVAMVAAATRRLKIDELDPDVVLGGGVFHNDAPWFIESISAAIRAFLPAARIVVPVDPPIVGAGLLALDRLGADSAAHARLREQLTRQRVAATPFLPTARTHQPAPSGR